MIIDSHAHYSHKMYQGQFPYLDIQNGELTVAAGDRMDLLASMERSGIAGCIEAGVCLERVEDQLALARHWGDFLRLTLGVHPKHCAQTPWKMLETLHRTAQTYPVVAIGETGLDYSLEPEAEERACQAMWFDAQMQLADAVRSPLVLHVRQAHGDALTQLEEHRSRLHGGVAHCFYGDYETARRYLDLGFSLGIGGKLLSEDAQGCLLRETVQRVPLEALVVETDAPFIRPDIRHLGENANQRKKIRNTSMILPLVICQIAEIKGETPEMVEHAIYDNTVALFRL